MLFSAKKYFSTYIASFLIIIKFSFLCAKSLNFFKVPLSEMTTYLKVKMYIYLKLTNSISSWGKKACRFKNDKGHANGSFRNAHVFSEKVGHKCFKFYNHFLKNLCNLGHPIVHISIWNFAFKTVHSFLQHKTIWHKKIRNFVYNCKAEKYFIKDIRLFILRHLSPIPVNINLFPVKVLQF